MADEPIEQTRTEARAGSTPGVVRYILIASMILIVAAFAIIVGMGMR